MIEKPLSPVSLTQADIKPIHKMDYMNDKESYRHVSILPNLSKIYERCLHTQMNKYFDSILSKHQFEFGFAKEI